MEAKRMRFNPTNNLSHNSQKLELKIWQNLQITKCVDDNYINRLLESTRSFLVQSEELTVENEAISTAISTFGLKKQTFDMFEDPNASDDSNLPSTSSQSPSSSRQHSSSSTSSTDTLALESEAINSAISSFGLHKNGI